MSKEVGGLILQALLKIIKPKYIIVDFKSPNRL